MPYFVSDEDELLKSISYDSVQDLVIKKLFLQNSKCNTTINLDWKTKLTYACAVFALSQISLYKLYSTSSTKRTLKIHFLLYLARKRFQ
jgi:hypothetical protein